MSRTKHRKAQRKESAKRKQFAIFAGLLIVTAGIVMFVIAQSQTSLGETTVEDGERPSWQDMSLINAKTGDSFVLSDFKDKHVVVKIMSPY